MSRGKKLLDRDGEAGEGGAVFIVILGKWARISSPVSEFTLWGGTSSVIGRERKHVYFYEYGWRGEWEKASVWPLGPLERGVTE